MAFAGGFQVVQKDDDGASYRHGKEDLRVYRQGVAKSNDIGAVALGVAYSGRDFDFEPGWNKRTLWANRPPSGFYLRRGAGVRARSAALFGSLSHPGEENGGRRRVFSAFREF